MGSPLEKEIQILETIIFWGSMLVFRGVDVSNPILLPIGKGKLFSSQGSMLVEKRIAV